MPQVVLGERQRRWAPKVRTGCLTCKKRKKRCDEQKPFCQTCIRGRYVCDGYQTTVKAKTAKSALSNIGVREPSQQSSNAAGTTGDESVSSLYTAKDQVMSSKSCLILSNGWLNAALSASDYKYTQFFVANVAPVLATTKQWRSFWETTIPCVSTYEPSVYHAMIALAATYESRATGVDRKMLATEQVNLAFRAMLSQPVSTENTLILCRLLASISQGVGDWRTAMIHLRHGWRILIQAMRDGQLDSSTVRLLAPTFLGACTGDVSFLDEGPQASTNRQTSISCLENIRSQFMMRLSSLDWSSIDSSKESFMLLCWSMLTQAICALICFDAYATADQGTVPVETIKTELANAEALLTLEQLQKVSTSLFVEMEDFLHKPCRSDTLWVELKHRLRRFVENFLVQAAEIQPDIKVGTFWHDVRGTGCDIVKYLSGRQQDTRLLTDIDSCSGAGHNQIREPKTEYYLEFVCPFRSGFMPAFVKLPG